MKRSVRFSEDAKCQDGQSSSTEAKRSRPERPEAAAARAVAEELEEGDGVDRFIRDKKHTLDSDEEYEEENYRRLDMRKVEGQEEATEEYDGEIKLMPFNMREDMEEGHFDSGGNFIFDKKEAAIKDAWLDNIDWDNVKRQAGKHWKKEGEDGEEEEDLAKSPGKKDIAAIYTRLLEILTSDKETVGNALKRMNSEKGLSAAEERKRRWAAKKAGSNAPPEEDAKNKAVMELTTLADSLISLGYMDAYQLNPPRIKDLLTEINANKDAATSKSSTYDMFDDAAEPVAPSASVSNADAVNSAEVTMWVYQLKDSEGKPQTNVHGPLTTAEITKKSTTSEEFQHGALVKRVGTETFHDIKRIDFELYE